MSDLTAWDDADGMCPNCITPWKCNGPHLADESVAGRRHAATPAGPEEPGLDAAWAEAEAALPEGWHGPSLYESDKGWTAYAVKHSLLRPMPVTVKDQPTPVDALRALAAALHREPPR